MSDLVIGTRIECVEMPGDPDPVPAGTLGTVTSYTNDHIYVDWDNGRTLTLLVDIDTYKVVTT